MMEILGHIDRLDAELAEGWITIAGEPERKLRLELVLDGKSIAHGVADRPREDLKQAGIGDGICAFSIPVPAFLPASELPRVEVRLENSAVALRAGGLEPDHSSETTRRETVSRFGGLWIDRYDWIDRLAAKHRSGELDDEESLQIFRFVRDGYLIIPVAVTSGLLDEVEAEIDRMWNAPPDGLLMETFEPDQVMKYIPPDIRHRGGRTKLLDAYAHSAVIRQVIASPRVVRFLTLIFEASRKRSRVCTSIRGRSRRCTRTLPTSRWTAIRCIWPLPG